MNTPNKQAELERKSDIVFNAGRNEGVIEGLEQGYAKALEDVGKYMRRRIIEQINKGKDLFSGGWILQEITKLEKTK